MWHLLDYNVTPLKVCVNNIILVTLHYISNCEQNYKVKVDKNVGNPKETSCKWLAQGSSWVFKGGKRLMYYTDILVLVCRRYHWQTAVLFVGMFSCSGLCKLLLLKGLGCQTNAQSKRGRILNKKLYGTNRILINSISDRCKQRNIYSTDIINITQ